MTKPAINSIDFAKAIADDTRQQIMKLCCCQWLSVNEIVDALQVTQPTVSHHLAILREAKLVDVRREGKQVFYTLNQARMAAACCNLAEDFAPELRIVLEPRNS